MHAVVPQPEPDLLSVPEFCRRLSISRSVAYEFIAAGEVVSLRVGRRRLVPRIEVQRFIDRRLNESQGLAA